MPKVSRALKQLLQFDNTDGLPPLDKALTGVYRLCISLLVALDILAIAYGEGHLSFSHCYKIIMRS